MSDSALSLHIHLAQEGSYSVAKSFFFIICNSAEWWLNSDPLDMDTIQDTR